MLTRMAVFYTIKNHLLNQMERAIGKNGYCCFRSPSGLSCAVGCMIPEDRYYPDFESITLVDMHPPATDVEIEFRDALESNGIDFDRDYPMLEDLQAIHDRKEPHNWEAELKELEVQLLDYQRDHPYDT